MKFERICEDMCAGRKEKQKMRVFVCMERECWKMTESGGREFIQKNKTNPKGEKIKNIYVYRRVVMENGNINIVKTCMKTYKAYI